MESRLRQPSASPSLQSRCMKVGLFSTKGSQDPEKFENLSEFVSLEDQEPSFGHLSVPKPCAWPGPLPSPTPPCDGEDHPQMSVAATGFRTCGLPSETWADTHNFTCRPASSGFLENVWQPSSGCWMRTGPRSPGSGKGALVRFASGQQRPSMGALDNL